MTIGIRSSRARILRETSGPTNLPIEDIAEGQTLARSGNKIVGVTGAGSSVVAIRTVAVSGPVLPTDNVIFVDATAAPVTLTLPLSSALAGRQLTVKRISTNANAVAVARAGADVIDGATSQSLANPYSGVSLTSDGVAAWYIA